MTRERRPTTTPFGQRTRPRLGSVAAGLAALALATGGGSSRLATASTWYQDDSGASEERGVAQESTGRPVATPLLRGVWELVEYTLADGTHHPLAGRIFFSEREWQVLFFVLDDNGAPRRGSAEGGEYEIEGERLVFHHGFHLSAGEEMRGLAESPLRMSASPGAEPEVARAVLVGDDLTVHFPSDNRILFRRR